jgi:hypothetical protein
MQGKLMFSEESRSVLDYTCENSNPWQLTGWLTGLVGQGVPGTFGKYYSKATDNFL